VGSVADGDGDPSGDGDGDGDGLSLACGVLPSPGVGLGCVARGDGVGVAVGVGVAGAVVDEVVDCPCPVESDFAESGLNSRYAARVTRKMASRIQVEVRTRRSRRISRPGGRARFPGWWPAG
jgi:hypothetical protein